jgi:hypothetical protein
METHQLIFIFCCRFNFKENVFRVKKFGVNFVWSLVALADDEDFSRFVTGGSRLCGVHPLEELVQHPYDGRVVLGTENFCDECTVLKLKILVNTENSNTGQPKFAFEMIELCYDAGKPVLK